MEEPIRIAQVLLLGNHNRPEQSTLKLTPEESAQVVQTVWAVFREVETLYNHKVRRARFRRFLLAPEVPGGVAGAEPVDQEAVAAELGSAHFWNSVRGDFRRTYDQARLAERARALAGLDPGGDRLMLVTDQEIIPPPKWSYIIWDTADDAEVVSLAPIDPTYWDLDDPDRILTIKRRLRTVCCSVVGSFLGLKRCDNPRCFLYTPILNVLDLDQMDYLGGEHRVPELTKLGFDPGGADPTVVQGLKLVQHRGL